MDAFVYNILCVFNCWPLPRPPQCVLDREQMACHKSHHCPPVSKSCRLCSPVKKGMSEKRLVTKVTQQVETNCLVELPCRNVTQKVNTENKTKTPCRNVTQECTGRMCLTRSHVFCPLSNKTSKTYNSIGNSIGNLISK